MLAYVPVFCFCLEAVNKSWKTLENEEGYRRCQEIIEEAKSRTDTLVSSIRADLSNTKYCCILGCLLLFGSLLNQMVYILTKYQTTSRGGIFRKGFKEGFDNSKCLTKVFKYKSNYRCTFIFSTSNS